MNYHLAKRLVEKGAIRTGTEIEAFYESREVFGCGGARLTGTFTIAAIFMSDQRVVFGVRGYSDKRKGGEVRRIPSDDVIMLDGMNPSRFAQSWGVLSSGIDAPKGKRRGRPPRVKVDG